MLNGLKALIIMRLITICPLISESANVVLANEKHMDILKMRSNHTKITVKMYKNCAQVSSMAES